jgi:hypothetical protein
MPNRPRIAIRLLQLLIVAGAAALPIVTLWLPIYLAQYWHRFAAPEPIEAILGGEVSAYPPPGGTLWSVYGLAPGGRVYRCDLKKSACVAAAAVCPGDPTICAKNLGLAPVIEILSDGARECNYRSDGIEAPQFALKAAASHYSFCNHQVAPLNTHFLLDATGGLWQASRIYDDHGTGASFVVFASVFSGLIGLAIAKFLGRVLTG